MRMGWRLAPVVTSSVVLATVTGVLVLAGPLRGRPLYATSVVVVSAALLVAGALTARTPRGRGVGLAMLLTGALWPTCWVTEAGTGVGPFVGWVDANLIFLVLGTGMLSYPDELRHTRAEKVFLALMWGSCSLAVAALAVLSHPEWNDLSSQAWWPTITPTRSGFQLTLVLVAISRVLLAGGGAALLTARLRAASGLDRAAVRPALLAILCSVGVVTGAGVAQLVAVGRDVDAAMLFVQGLALLAVPGALVVILVRDRMLQARVLARLLGDPGQPSVESLRTVLRRELYDDSLELMLWTDDRRRLVDAAGQPASMPVDDSRFQAPLVGSDGRVLGLVFGDPGLEEHRPLVASALGAAVLELENATLRDGLRAVRNAADTRLTRVSHVERRRLERDLHDGAQQHLLAIAMRLERTSLQVTELELRRTLQQIRAELQDALVEVRDLAHGIAPASLQAGLGPAVRGLADGMPIPVRVRLPDRRFPALVEGTAYLVASEALANVVKHAQARSAEVVISATTEQLCVCVCDDGVGGASLLEGSGLHGLADRVESLGGSLRVDSPAGRGTSLVAVIPCA